VRLVGCEMAVEAQLRLCDFSKLMAVVFQDLLCVSWVLFWLLFRLP